VVIDTNGDVPVVVVLLVEEFVVSRVVVGKVVVVCSYNSKRETKITTKLS